MDEKGLGRRLQAARIAGGFTQQTLCQRAGLSYSTLTKIERGAIKAPSIFTIQSIANVLQVDLNELLGQPSSRKSAKRQSKSGIRFVYFDVNGCLVRFYHRAFNHLADEAGMPADTVETVFWHYNDAICRGEISMTDFNKSLARDLHLASVDWLTYYLEAIEPIDGMTDLLTWASTHYRVGLLTNIMPGFVGAMKKQGLIPDIAYDAIIDSSEVKAIKPEAAIYSVATEQAHCPGSEILLVDDSRTNLIAAQKQDWRVLWFDNYRPDESVARIRAALDFDA